MIRFPDKDPDAVLDYKSDWTDWLALNGNDTLLSATWTVPPDLVLESSGVTDTTAIAFIGGGEVGERYEFTVHITTAGGREDDRSYSFRVKER